MFLVFTPFSFIFLSLYVLVIFLMLTISNFYLFWLLIEVLILLMIGVSYSVITSSFSSLLLYFLIQTFSSFTLLVGFLSGSELLFSLAYALKLGLFPFHFWFLSLVYALPNLIFYLCITFHNIPALLIVAYFSLPLKWLILWSLIIFSIFVSSLLIVTSNDLRFILTSSSVGNNSWFIFSVSSSFTLFLFFFLSYSLLLYFLIQTFSSFTVSYGLSPTALFCLLSLSGLPPFPVFYAKIIILLSLFLSSSYNIYLFLFILCACLMLVGYVQSLFKLFVHKYSCASYILL